MCSPRSPEVLGEGGPGQPVEVLSEPHWPRPSQGAGEPRSLPSPRALRSHGPSVGAARESGVSCGPRCPHLFPPLTMVTSSPGRPISQGQEHNCETYTGRCAVCALCRGPNTTPTGHALPVGLRALPSTLGASPLLVPFVDALELPPSPALSIKTPPFKTLLCSHPNTDSSPGRPLPGVHLPPVPFIPS